MNHSIMFLLRSSFTGRSRLSGQLAFLIVCWSLCWGVGTDQLAAQSRPFWTEAVEAFREKVSADVQSDNVGGITAAVVIGDRVVWSEGFGWHDREAKIPTRPDGVYRIGSISKPFATILLAQLAQAGKLNLDDSVLAVLPELAPLVDPAKLAEDDSESDNPTGNSGRSEASEQNASPKITWRQLATHTSGLSREPALRGHSNGSVDQWEDKLVAALPTAQLQSPPGSRVSYSNIGFAALGLAISRVGERSYIELMEENIFAKLGMENTSFRPQPEWQEKLAVGYSNRANANGEIQVNSQQPAREHAGRGYRVPNGGIYSTVDDLAKLMAEMFGLTNQLGLDEQHRAELMRLQTPGSRRDGYGLGFSVSLTDQATRHVGHGGTVAGYTAQILFDPEAQVGVILLRNYNQGKTNLKTAASRLLAEIVAQQPLAPLAQGLDDFTFVDWKSNPYRPVQVFTYLPANFQPESPILFVMHGTLRNAETYRQPWVTIADEYGCLVVCPEFSTEHYGGSFSYHFGNIVDNRSRPRPEESWTFNVVERLFDHLRRRTESQQEKYHIFGHSAGGQFVHRMVTMKPDSRIAVAIAANAGSYTLPDRETSFPYGLQGMTYEDQRFRQALQAPLIILLGEEDNDPNDQYLPKSRLAMAQGPHRLARGGYYFQVAQQAAEQLDVELGWKVSVVPGVGHDNALMAPAAAKLLFGK